MKRLLSLLLVVVMLFAVLAMVGCDKGGDDETTTDTKPVETTKETDPPETTPDTTKDTEPPETTPDTTKDTEPPATTPDTTKDTEPPATTLDTKPSESTEGTTLTVFARFDFGTKTKAEAEGKTSHEYLTSALTYDANCIAIEYTEDTIVIYATKSYTSGMDVSSFELCFDDIITYDFDEELKHGWGSWVQYPFSTANVGKSWQGRYQYVKVRILNNTSNNMISFRWHRTADGYASTMVCSNMYLQGGAPTTAGNANLTTTPTTEWKFYTYDIMFLNGLASAKTSGAKTYVDFVNEVKNAGGVPGNNLIWTTSDKLSALRFSFLGAFSSNNAAACDSRSNIKEGNKVEVDYVVFGCSVDQLAGYTSYLEDSSNAAK